jgi:hypothetical protein
MVEFLKIVNINVFWEYSPFNCQSSGVLATGFMASTFTCHLPTTLGTGATRLNAFIHTANFFAIVSTRLADFRAYFAKTMLKLRVTELEID